ncbi:hypothetical protein BTO30_00535 [Domibacillus antri]|uniref:DUF2442 domain-containing protein n=1 Tax=Domibacillus antri TaxID=1714264 RepID=A0A1Q8Q9D9_9BACI|nr:hypothetical protein BTO30_00535 [Domibacillus antri]
MKITAVFACRTFKLIMEVNHVEYWLLDMKEFLRNDEGKFSELRDDVNTILSLRISEISGTLVWSNGVNFDTAVLVENSMNVDFLLGRDK